MPDGPQPLSGTADDPALPESAGLEIWEWMRTNHLEPEVRRRMEAGELEEGTVIHRAQVVFWLDRDRPEVRLNGEVSGQAMAVAARDIAKGEELTTDDISGVSGYMLPEEDGDAPHVTMFSTASGLSIVFDGAYNTLLIGSQLNAADEFIGLTETALERGSLRGFAENAFAATELLARAELLSLPDRRVAKGRTHRTTKGLYNQWAKLGNTERRFAELLNRLGDLREPARYLQTEFSLDPATAARHMATLHDMRRHVESVRPKRALETTPTAYRTVTARDVRGGEVIGPDDMILFR